MEERGSGILNIFVLNDSSLLIHLVLCDTVQRTTRCDGANNK